MSLIACPNCSKDVSKNALSCPNCNADISIVRSVKQSKTKPCRGCGDSLVVGSHRYAIKHHLGTEWRDGTSYERTLVSVYHQPCPKCGEPRPHARFKDSPFASYLTLGVMLSIFVCYFIFQKYIADHFYIFGIGIAFFMLVAYLYAHEKIDRVEP